MGRALLIVDVQNDFCEGGSLPVTGGAAVAAAISDALETGDWDHIVATQDAHIDPGAHFGHPPDYRDTWPEHCVVGTAGAEFHPALRTDRIEITFRKGAHAAAYSGFEATTEDGTPLAEWLRAHDVTEVEIAGLTTDHCVRATALDAVREGFPTTVLLPLTAGVAAETTRDAVAAMRAAGVILTGAPAAP